MPQDSTKSAIGNEFSKTQEFDFQADEAVRLLLPQLTTLKAAECPQIRAIRRVKVSIANALVAAGDFVEVKEYFGDLHSLEQGADVIDQMLHIPAMIAQQHCNTRDICSRHWSDTAAVSVISSVNLYRDTYEHAVVKEAKGLLDMQQAELRHGYNRQARKFEKFDPLSEPIVLLSNEGCSVIFPFVAFASVMAENHHRNTTQAVVFSSNTRETDIAQELSRLLENGWKNTTLRNQGVASQFFDAIVNEISGFKQHHPTLTSAHAIQVSYPLDDTPASRPFVERRPHGELMRSQSGGSDKVAHWPQASYDDNASCISAVVGQCMFATKEQKRILAFQSALTLKYRSKALTTIACYPVVHKISARLALLFKSWLVTPIGSKFHRIAVRPPPAVAVALVAVFITLLGLGLWMTIIRWRYNIVKMRRTAGCHCFDTFSMWCTPSAYFVGESHYRCASKDAAEISRPTSYNGIHALVTLWKRQGSGKIYYQPKFTTSKYKTSMPPPIMLDHLEYLPIAYLVSLVSLLVAFGHHLAKGRKYSWRLWRWDSVAWGILAWVGWSMDELRPSLLESYLCSLMTWEQNVWYSSMTSLSFLVTDLPSRDYLPEGSIIFRYHPYGKAYTEAQVCDCGQVQRHGNNANLYTPPAIASTYEIAMFIYTTSRAWGLSNPGFGTKISSTISFNCDRLTLFQEPDHYVALDSPLELEALALHSFTTAAGFSMSLQLATSETRIASTAGAIELASSSEHQSRIWRRYSQTYRGFLDAIIQLHR
ncbi:uncharacterized protein MYCFIDRAFT_207461 [Pseudocercospora fijiensis CIRAD86]|uniref:Uncharacterized protein n=1 Tax=Pseudocercospora fijiensis (strain CIRAD86) TaxID=383855 RepID=M3AKA2_PSEFD|nr:uncharacterized protein MYCFIDRAFT_207461 [Pseudocercospora fijiensis CIRAD86]EME85011.1 hypothetical protein MYCFIDRAFT_207461 [Pseudocercospora fijiensis CIRAD86]